jgi:hypothetical protein
MEEQALMGGALFGYGNDHCILVSRLAFGAEVRVHLPKKEVPQGLKARVLIGPSGPTEVVP